MITKLKHITTRNYKSKFYNGLIGKIHYSLINFFWLYSNFKCNSHNYIIEWQQQHYCLFVGIHLLKTSYYTFCNAIATYVHFDEYLYQLAKHNIALLISIQCTLNLIRINYPTTINDIKINKTLGWTFMLLLNEFFFWLSNNIEWVIINDIFLGCSYLKVVNKILYLLEVFGKILYVYINIF